MRWVRALFAMSRPLQLVAVTLVYLIGVAIAGAMDIDLERNALWLGYLALIPTSASIHYANEYADYETDALTTRTPFSGGSGALPETGLPRWLALRAAQATLGIGSLIALVGVLLNVLSVAALFVLAFGAFFGWMYSLPPLQLAWRGWGELDNAALGGVVLPLYGFTVQAGYIDPEVIAICLPFGALVFINLLATTWPDRTADAQVGKYTLATQWPYRRLRALYAAGAMTGFGALLAMANWLVPPLVLAAALLPVPIVLWGWVVYTRWETPFPTVFAMVIMMNAYLLSWGILAF
jgi:1,4-dihydroxy-2-naphthoate polyprenyltransferase